MELTRGTKSALFSENCCMSLIESLNKPPVSRGVTSLHSEDVTDTVCNHGQVLIFSGTNIVIPPIYIECLTSVQIHQLLWWKFITTTMVVVQGKRTNAHTESLSLALAHTHTHILTQMSVHQRHTEATKHSEARNTEWFHGHTHTSKNVGGLSIPQRGDDRQGLKYNKRSRIDGWGETVNCVNYRYTTPKLGVIFNIIQPRRNYIMTSELPPTTNEPKTVH